MDIPPRLRSARNPNRQLTHPQVGRDRQGSEKPESGRHSAHHRGRGKRGMHPSPLGGHLDELEGGGGGVGVVEQARSDLGGVSYRVCPCCMTVWHGRERQKLRTYRRPVLSVFLRRPACVATTIRAGEATSKL